jgi:hypothetical protein
MSLLLTLKTLTLPSANFPLALLYTPKLTGDVSMVYETILTLFLAHCMSFLANCEDRKKARSLQ